MSEENLIYGVTQAEWDAAYDSDVVDFVANNFLLKRDGLGFVRVAFGRLGAPIDESGKTRPIKYTHAVTVTEHIALEMARILRGSIADDKEAMTTDD